MATSIEVTNFGTFNGGGGLCAERTPDPRLSPALRKPACALPSTRRSGLRKRQVVSLVTTERGFLVRQPSKFITDGWTSSRGFSTRLIVADLGLLPAYMGGRRVGVDKLAFCDARVNLLAFSVSESVLCPASRMQLKRCCLNGCRMVLFG